LIIELSSYDSVIIPFDSMEAIINDSRESSLVMNELDNIISLGITDP
jgi:hypothetical protein